MFLLNRFTKSFTEHGFVIFTFHNVSIKSIDEAKAAMIDLDFTFHNVSIKSNLRFDFNNL